LVTAYATMACWLQLWNNNYLARNLQKSKIELKGKNYMSYFVIEIKIKSRKSKIVTTG
jgi:hypothetical protein